MPKTKISEFSATPANNTDIDSINIAEGCAPSGINDAIRELMAQLKDFQTGAVGDSFNGPVGTTTAAAGAFTTLSASSTLSVTGAGSIQGLTVGRGAGAVSTNTAVGASALAANTTGASNTAVGQNALLANTDGTQNTAVGRAALTANTSGVLNSGFGRSALLANTSGANNTAVGGSALASNTTASYNTAVGYQAGYTNTTGLITAVGSQALNQNTTGVNNVAVGGYTSGVNYAALTFNTTGSNNTAVGNGALQANTTASNNTAVGYQAGYSNTTGVSNVFVGESAGRSSTANGNTFVGQDAGFNVTSGANNTIIGGYNGNQGGLDIRTASNYIVLSDGDGNPRGIFDSGGNFLVGATSTPVAGYNCFSEAGADVQLILQRTGGSVGYGGIGAQEAYAFIVYQGGSGTLTQRFYVTQAGATYNTTGTYGTISDIKIKENIQDSRGYLDDLCKVRIVKYSLKADAKSVPDKLGVIAQELEQIFPNMIEEQPDVVNGKEVLDTTTKTVKYSVFVPMLIKAIQEQQAIIESLKARLDAANL